jgi:hypothetical protein
MSTLCVHDVDRPDVGGVAPKMLAICEATKEALQAPWLQILTDDNLCSSVTIKGSLEPKSEWQSGIWMNSRYFMFFIHAEKGKRYYEDGDRVSVELHTCHGVNKFRKYTATPEKVIAKLKTWIESH